MARNQSLIAQIDAVAPCLEVLKAEGFKAVRQEFDGKSAQPNAISLERVRGDELDFVRIIFDKFGRGRFKVISGTRLSAPPYNWVRAGDLVRWSTDDDAAKWWGTSWWNLNKQQAVKAAAMKVARLLPQFLTFLSDGSVGRNVYQWPMENQVRTDNSESPRGS